MSLPSTCEEVYGLLDYEYFYIKYNGPMADFYKIKGVNDMLATGKDYTVICNDGEIKR